MHQAAAAARAAANPTGQGDDATRVTAAAMPTLHARAARHLARRMRRRRPADRSNASSRALHRSSIRTGHRDASIAAVLLGSSVRAPTLRSPKRGMRILRVSSFGERPPTSGAGESGLIRVDGDHRAADQNQCPAEQHGPGWSVAEQKPTRWPALPEKRRRCTRQSAGRSSTALYSPRNRRRTVRVRPRPASVRGAAPPARGRQAGREHRRRLPAAPPAAAERSP
jgi:hypothetical protein